MSLVVQAFHEFTRDVPLALGLLTAFCIALALELLVIIRASRRGSEASPPTTSSRVAKPWKVHLCLFLSGLPAVGFPVLARASVVRSWARIQGALTLASGTERAAEYSPALTALLGTFCLVPILVSLVELLACFGIGLSLAELWSMKQPGSPGGGAPQVPPRWDGGELAIVLALFLILSIGPVVLGGLWQTFALNHGFDAVAHSARATKLQVMNSMLAKAQAQLDAGSRLALPGTILAVAASVALLLPHTRRWTRSSSDDELQAWQNTLIFALVGLLAGTGLWAWSAPLKAEADMPFPLPAAVPIVRLPNNLPPTIDFVGPDEIDTGPLVAIRRQGTTVDGVSQRDDELVQQFRRSTAWQLREEQSPVEVPADTLSVVMASDAPMEQLDLVVRAARAARYRYALFVAPRTESMERPMLGRLELQLPTAAKAWLGTPAVIAPGAHATTSTLKIGDYPDYGIFIRELVRRRQSGMQVTLGLP